MRFNAETNERVRAASINSAASPAISGIEEVRQAITAAPQASASTTGRPNPSDTQDTQKRGSVRRVPRDPRQDTS
jgi:hypothetical protein